MKNPRMKQIFAMLIAAAVLCFSGGSVFGVSEGSVYTVNEWNYVDSSMDVSGGIPDDASGTLARIRERGVLRVATEPYYPPQEFIDPAFDGQDKYRGADMELARLIAERMGVDLQMNATWPFPPFHLPRDAPLPIRCPKETIFPIFPRP